MLSACDALGVVRMGNFTWRGWKTSAEDAPQPTSIIFGANLRSQRKIDGPGYDRETDFVMQALAKHGIPLTRENYLGLAYPEGLPEGWSAVDELSLPPEIRT